MIHMYTYTENWEVWTLFTLYYAVTAFEMSKQYVDGVMLF